MRLEYQSFDIDALTGNEGSNKKSYLELMTENNELKCQSEEKEKVIQNLMEKINYL